MFELLLQLASVTADGSSVQINDVSNYTLAAHPRTGYGIFITGDFRVSSDPTAVEFAPYTPTTATNFLAKTPKNGRYSFKAYLFLQRGVEAPAEGDVQVYPVDQKLYKWVSGAWVLTTLQESLDKAKYTSAYLELPYLGYAYIYRNNINLEYIKAVKKEIDKGAEQNKLFYKRTSLDYVNSLIDGAEYNWALGFYNNFYQITVSLNNIIETGNLE